MLTVDRFACIRQLHRDGLSPRQIASQLGHSPKTILKALRQPELTPSRRGRQVSDDNVRRNCNGDQLTAELRSFVDCVRANRTPRVPGEAGRDALALVERVHQWEGRPEGAVGPNDMPRVTGKLFESPKGQSEAA